MKRIIKLTESDLTRIVRRVLNEQRTTIKLCTEYGVQKEGFCNKDKKPVRFGPCAYLGIRNPGFCEFKTKKMVEFCHKLDPRPKTPCKVCYATSKQVVPGTCRSMGI